jgi:N-acetylmuramoyl-L-alanine amidase CwlA
MGGPQVRGQAGGRGEWAGTEVTSDPVVAKLCATAFEAVWERGTDHEDFRLAR